MITIIKIVIIAILNIMIKIIIYIYRIINLLSLHLYNTNLGINNV